MVSLIIMIIVSSIINLIFLIYRWFKYGDFKENDTNKLWILISGIFIPFVNFVVNIGIIVELIVSFNITSFLNRIFHFVFKRKKHV